MKRATRGVTLHAGGIPRATVIDNADGGCTRSEDPGPSHWLREERATSPPVPHAERRVAACSFRCAPPPSPAAPTQATPAKLSCPVLNTPAIPADTLSAGRPYKKAHAPRQRLAQAGAGSTRLRRASTVSSFARLLRVFDRLPTGSSSSSTHGPQGRPRMGLVPP